MFIMFALFTIENTYTFNGRTVGPNDIWGSRLRCGVPSAPPGCLAPAAPPFEHGALNPVNSSARDSGVLTLRYVAEDRHVELADELGIG